MTVPDRVIDRSRRLPPTIVDGGLGAVIFLANLLPNPFAFPLSYVLADAAAALTVTLRRRNLVAACGLFALTGVAGLAAHAPWTDPTADGQALYLAALILLYSVAERAPILIARLALPASIVIEFILGRGHIRRLDLVYDTFVYIPWIFIAWFAGRAQARRRAIASDLERSAEELRNERELLVRGAVAAERARIAHDLHALVLRGVNRMNAETRTARRLLSEDPAAACHSIGAIEADGRTTLVEMRRLLLLLRARQDYVDRSTGGAPRPEELMDRTLDGGRLGRDPAGDRGLRTAIPGLRGLAIRWIAVPWITDAVVVSALAVMGLAEHVFAARARLPNGVLLGCCLSVGGTMWLAAMVGVLLWRRRAPLIVLGLVAALNFIPYQFHVGAIAWTGDMAVAVAAYTAAAQRGPRWGIVSIGAVALSYSAVGGGINFAWWMVGWALQYGLAAIAGLAVYRSRELSAELSDQTEVLRQTREERVRLAVVEERARVARDVHDLVAHGVTLMVIQAGAARWLAKGDAAQADRALSAVERAGQEALRELRSLVGSLDDAAVGSELLPTGEQLSLRCLVDHEADAGMNIDLVVVGEPRPLEVGMELSVYRIVQEALTNVRRHAPGARAWVEVAYTPDGVRIEVTDTGGSGERTLARSVPGAGYGLVGIAERAALFGGRAEAGPTGDGGFRVSAYLADERVPV